MSEFNNASLLALIDYTRRKALEEAAKAIEAEAADAEGFDPFWAHEYAKTVRALAHDD